MSTKQTAKSIKALQEKAARAHEKAKAADDELRSAMVAKRARERTAARRVDSRKKLLDGVVLQAALAAGYVQAESVQQWRCEFIKRTREREFLGLPPLPVEKAEGAGDA